MSLADVLKLAGKPVPGLDAAIKTGKASPFISSANPHQCTVGVIYTQYRDVKVYRVSGRSQVFEDWTSLNRSPQEQCGYLASRCIALLLAVHESSADMVGTSAMMYADEIEG